MYLSKTFPIQKRIQDTLIMFGRSSKIKATMPQNKD